MIHLNIAEKSYEESIELIRSSVTDIHDVACTIEFGADHSQSKIIRDFVGMIFDAHGIHVPWRWRFILITDELVNNAIEHGSSAWDLDLCIIEARRKADGNFFITLEVHDTGTGKDAKDANHMEAIKNTKLQEHDEHGIYMEKRGRWLFHITEKLVDRLSFSESPKWWLAVKIEKNITIEGE